jgi:acetyl-CoA carboxylase carboxyltransferase component
MHAAISGTVDFREPDDEACLRRIRSLVEKMGRRAGASAAVRSAFHHAPPEEPLYPVEQLYGIYESEAGRPYDMREVIARVVDGSRFDEYKAEYGQTLLCGYARIGGWAVGIVANQKLHVEHRDQQGNRRLEFGGVIYTESADKAARFIMDCNQNLIPLVFLHDVNGFMVGRDAEASGIIRAGAKMVSAVANSVVPKITVIVGGSFGAGHYAMCGKAYDPRFIFAWPSARYAVMSGESAAGTLAEIKAKQLERDGRRLSEEEMRELRAGVQQTYARQMDPRYGAARLWLDRIIDPVDTRQSIATALEAAAHNPDVPRFNVGVLQT